MQGVSVRRGANDRLGADIAAGPGPVLGDERLAEPIGQPSAYQARDDVRCSSGDGADDETHRPGWIGLRPCEARGGCERRCADGPKQELSSVGKSRQNVCSRQTAEAQGSRYLSRPPGLKGLSRWAYEKPIDVCANGTDWLGRHESHDLNSRSMRDGHAWTFGRPSHENTERSEYDKQGTQDKKDI
jgi:hypothetical protein